MGSFIPSFTIPSADPPYPILIRRDGAVILETDNYGIKFTLLGDKTAAAIAYIEYFYARENIYVHAPDEVYTTRIGPIDFVHQNKKILAVKPHYTTKQEYIPHTPEDRPDVLEMIDLIRSSASSMMKMKAFW